MGKRSADEMKSEVLQVVELERQERIEDCENQSVKTELGTETQHPYAFHVSGPRNVPSINWRDLINSTCSTDKKNRTNDTALAPKWWTPFKYKLVETLIDERDGSIFGAILEWDRAAALADFVLLRPSGAPRAVLALRGTLLKSPTIRRDIEDDLRFLTWESLKGSVRFSCAYKALKSISEKYGSSNVCIAGHSLGAGFALQIGKALAKEAIFVEAHLFNPPSVSLASSLRTVGEKAGTMWKRVRSMLPSSNENENETPVEGVKSITLGSKKWVPHLYVNNSDYICCYYNDPVETENGDGGGGEKENAKPANNTPFAAKLFVLSKGKQKFLEAHGLEQWWSDDLELQMALNDSKLISRQLKSLTYHKVHNHNTNQERVSYRVLAALASNNKESEELLSYIIIRSKHIS
ncbi:hypothetical protein DH2020_011349 [Rehmannia glutinosa]|uniref:GDSL esterase/lipase n=1 Tax=Rehmannia glutinosa TaxID=99300 RepID=A0ABR0XD90_REHGL